MLRNKLAVIFFLIILTIIFVGSLAFADSKQITILSHRVHMDATTKGEGGDLITPWQAKNEIDSVQWQTYGTSDLHERMFREASLDKSDIDLAFIVNSYFFPRVSGLLEPLNSYLENYPIPGFPEDFNQGMLKDMTINGQLYGIPVRAATSALIYNDALFKERGLNGPPKTIEEFYLYAKKLTFTKDDGTKIYGLIMPGLKLYSHVINYIRAWDGDFITNNYEIAVNQPAAIKGVEMLAKMYKEGILPSNLSVLEDADYIREMQMGRAAMVVATADKVEALNDPEQSPYAGEFKVAPLPISEELADKYKVAPVKTEFWSMVILKSAQKKELSWDLIRYLASSESTLVMALNGNGPTRQSTYLDEKYLEMVPYAKVLEEVLPISRAPIPAFDESSRALDLIDKYLEMAIVGKMDTQKAMDELATNLKRFMP